MNTPTDRAIAWLHQALFDVPADIKMLYIDSGESVTAKNEIVARYDLFGFRSVPAGGFDPDNADHVADLGSWDWEANANCTFADVPFDAEEWLQVLAAAIAIPAINDQLKKRNLLMLFADHDGPINVVR